MPIIAINSERGFATGGRRPPLGGPVAAGSESLAAILPGPDRLPPPTVRQIPGDRLVQPAFEVFAGFPPQLAPDLGDIHRVAPVVARTIGYKGDQPLMRPIGRSRQHLVEQQTD